MFSSNVRITYVESEEPAEGILADGVEGPLVGEAVELPLVLLPPQVARLLLVKAHQRLARLPRPLAPDQKYTPARFITSKARQEKTC